MAVNGTIVEIDDAKVLGMMDLLDMSTKENRSALRKGFARTGSIIRAAVRRGSKRVLHNNISERQKSIYVRTYHRDMLGVIVGINKTVNLKREGNRWFGLHFIELGTKGHPDNKGKWHGKRMHTATPPHPFFATSVESVLTQAQSSVSENIVKQIVRISHKRWQ